MKYKLGIFGTGTMGQAILSRIVAENKLRPDQIALYDIDQAKLQSFSGGYKLCAHPQEIADGCEYVLFSVKPQHYRSITDSVRFSKENTILSIMAGVKIATLRGSLNYPCPIVRIMPNTPCKFGKGVCGVHCSGTTKEAENTVFDWLSACGGLVPIEEDCFDAVTSVSGSGPAYVYMFIEGMIRGGMAGGLTFEQSKQLTVDTFIGAAEMVKNTDEPLPELIDKVCSKGGTTIEAVNVYRNSNLEEIIMEGVNACRERSAQLSRGE